MRTRAGLLNYDRQPRTKEFLLFTGNAYVREDGALVMGRGAAKQVRDYHKGIDLWLGQQILARGMSCYGLIIHQRRIGVFQVKESYRDQANMDLIDIAARTLTVVALSFPNMLFQCNYPGIGNGGLELKDVRPVLEAAKLPDNVVFWLQP